MAKVDWETTRDLIQVELDTPIDGTDRIIAQLNVDTLTQYGVPYDVSFTGAIDAEKDAIESERAADLSTWSTDTAICHDDTISLINYMESLILASVTFYAAFDPDVGPSKDALVAFQARLGALITGLPEKEPVTFIAVPTPGESFDAGQLDVMREFHREIGIAYKARPDGTQGSNDFTETLILIPGVGNRSIEQVDTFLTKEVAKGVELLPVL